MGGGQKLERRNVERPIFRSFKITNIKITKDQLFNCFIFEFIFSLLLNCKILIFQIVIFNVYFLFFSFENSLIFQTEQFRIFYHFRNQSIIAIWKMDNFQN